ncbi:peptidoglycan-binding domain-containing protein [Streptomyces sp. SP18CS02]|uniref:peptidoglycan-binding domain-containing protein n=1 Tax=Streptomyces sp. SP18CS02 TaxID=3002531 RepID=UPI003FCD77A4
MTRPGEVAAEFDQEWVRPYLTIHEGVPGDGRTATTTVTWVIPRVVQEPHLSPGAEDTLPPVAMTRASHRRPHRARKPRRALQLTAALATLAGSAAIAGAYTFSRGSDTTEVMERPPASRLEVLDPGEDSAGSPSPDHARGTPPGTPGRTTPTPGYDLVGTSSSASASASRPAASTGTGAATAPSPAQGSPDTTTTSPAPATSAQGPTLRRHDRGPEVVELQQRFTQIGLWPYPQRGHYNRHLYDAVQRFQTDHGVRGDTPGVYGPATRRLLESMTS